MRCNKCEQLTSCAYQNKDVKSLVSTQKILTLWGSRGYSSPHPWASGVFTAFCCQQFPLKHLFGHHHWWGSRQDDDTAHYIPPGSRAARHSPPLPGAVTSPSIDDHVWATSHFILGAASHGRLHLITLRYIYNFA